MIKDMELKTTDSRLVLEFSTASYEDTLAAAAVLSKGRKERLPLFLNGGLGAGKTCFVKGLARGAGIPEDEVTSPTFVILREYRGMLAHADLYRITDAEELFYSGFSDSLETMPIVAVEWAERVDLSEWIEDYLEVNISTDDELGFDFRRFEIISHGMDDFLSSCYEGLQKI
jgi:tRNA threonylcarbamoyladenosine biosynthesis protein TsaE